MSSLPNTQLRFSHPLHCESDAGTLSISRRNHRDIGVHSAVSVLTYINTHNSAINSEIEGKN